MAIYTQGFGTRTEIIVRHAVPGRVEYNTDRGACLDDPSIDIPFRTGFNGSLPCVCVPSLGDATASINCDGTPLNG